MTSLVNYWIFWQINERFLHKQFCCAYTSIYKWLWINVVYSIIKPSSVLEHLICRDIAALGEPWSSVSSHLKFRKIKMWIRRFKFRKIKIWIRHFKFRKIKMWIRHFKFRKSKIWIRLKFQSILWKYFTKRVYINPKIKIRIFCPVVGYFL